jgi:flagellar hook-associated protein 2
MSSITPLRFTGISTFSEDFQAIMNRAVQIAALPIKQLQNEQSGLITKKQSLTALNTNLQSLTAAVEKLGELGRTRSLTVTSSNTSRVTVVNNGVAGATSYAITDIESVAKAASETSLTGLATPDTTAVDADDDLVELVVGSETYALDLSGGANNLDGLRDAINESGADVTATVLNTGSNYYLSVTANAPGATTLQVRRTAGDAGTNIVTATNQGANARFKLNGLQVEKSDNVITDVIPGLTFTIREETDEEETVNLIATSSRAGVSTALGDFVTAYNDTMSKLKLQIGENAGLLSGDFIVGQVSRVLRQVTGYQASSGTVTSLAALGIELDRQGVMSFDSTKLFSLGTSAVESAFDFLGTESTGFGGLSDKLAEISNPISGLIKTQQNTYDEADLRMQKQIDDLTARVERMQSSLSFKLQQADTLLAGLQSQQSQLEASLKSVSLALYGKQS